VIPVRFAREVPDELAEAVLWYEAKREGLGREFLGEVQATLPLIGERPRSFPRLQDVDATLEIRRALLARFPYALVFPRPGARSARAGGGPCEASAGLLAQPRPAVISPVWKRFWRSRPPGVGADPRGAATGVAERSPRDR